MSTHHKDAYYQILVNEGASQVQAAMVEHGAEEKLHSFGGLYMCLPTTKGLHSSCSCFRTSTALIATRFFWLTLALAFQAASRVNNITADYTHCQWMAKADFLENCNPASNPGKAGFSWILSRISGDLRPAWRLKATGKSNGQVKPPSRISLRPRCVVPFCWVCQGRPTGGAQLRRTGGVLLCAG